MPKKIGKRDIIGQKGINIIEKAVLEMGFIWYPTGGIEAGIDGFIEVRDDMTEEVSNSIIQVQSKATERSRLLAENDFEFEHKCERRDIDYWLQGNAPVILIVVRVSTRQAYWISLKEHFRDPSRRRSCKARFNKQKDCFDASAKDALLKLAVPHSSGLYLAPQPKQEKLYSNLLKVSQFGEKLYTAYTVTEDESKAYSSLIRIGRNLGGEWILDGNFVLSFHDLREEPWTKICDSGTVEEHNTEEWALSNIQENKRKFVELLNKTLREKIKSDLLFDQAKKCYYFKAESNLSVKKHYYKSLEKKYESRCFFII